MINNISGVIITYQVGEDGFYELLIMSRPSLKYNHPGMAILTSFIVYHCIFIFNYVKSYSY